MHYTDDSHDYDNDVGYDHPDWDNNSKLECLCNDDPDYNNYVSDSVLDGYKLGKQALERLRHSLEFLKPAGQINGEDVLSLIEVLKLTDTHMQFLEKRIELTEEDERKALEADILKGGEYLGGECP